MKLLSPAQATLLAIFLTASIPASAREEGGAGPGGGDRCEARFKTIAADLQKWIKGNGAQGLSLNAGLTPAQYSARMLAQLGTARITCVGPGDEGHPVQVDGRSKECVNFVDANGTKRVLCDREKFYSGLRRPENDPVQYKIVHHEYAGLAGLEIPDGDDSQYTLSDQIEEFLEGTVKKLVVKPSVRRGETEAYLCQTPKGMYRVSKYLIPTFLGDELGFKVQLPNGKVRDFGPSDYGSGSGELFVPRGEYVSYRMRNTARNEDFTLSDITEASGKVSHSLIIDVVGSAYPCSHRSK